MQRHGRRFRKFQSAPLLREATYCCASPRARLAVSIRASLARGDSPRGFGTPAKRSFNPRLSCERRPVRRQPLKNRPGFNPRLSCERRPAAANPVPIDCAFQSAPLLREATSPFADCSAGRMFQSAPLLREATIGRAQGCHRDCFNPRLSCERRPHVQLVRVRFWRFNPRLSCERRLPVML